MRPKVNATIFALMIRELQDGPSSTADIVRVTGMLPATVRGYLQKLHGQRCTHIIDYELDCMGRQRAPIYMMGSGRDTPRRSPTTWAQRAKSQRARQPMRELYERLAA